MASSGVLSLNGYLVGANSGGGGGTASGGYILRIIAESSFYGNTVTVKDEDGNIVAQDIISATGITDIEMEDNGTFTVVCGAKKTLAYIDKPYGVYKCKLKNATVYTIVIDTTKLYDNPNDCAYYIDDCEDFEPAYMDYSTGEFNYGSWKNAFFMPRPCMLKKDKTVDYYLDENDYSLKEDGTASDIANTGYAGNAMVEVPTVYTYSRQVGTLWYISISDAKATDAYEAYDHHRMDGSVADYRYWSIYEGSNVSNILRSLSGRSPMVSQQGTTERSYAQANGSGHDIWTYSDFMLRFFIACIMGKGLNASKIFGRGRADTSSLIQTGTMNTKGLFWGSQDGTSGVKFMGIENPWGNIWKRCIGLYSNNNAVYYKLTYGTEDGSTVNGYPNVYTGTISAGVSMGGTSGGYISSAVVRDHCIVPQTASGAENKYISDGLWFVNDVNALAIVGGSWGGGGLCGPLAVYLSAAVSYSYAAIGAALSCEQAAA